VIAHRIAERVKYNAAFLDLAAHMLDPGIERIISILLPHRYPGLLWVEGVEVNGYPVYRTTWTWMESEARIGEG
jgi:hypothetical protein